MTADGTIQQTTNLDNFSVEATEFLINNGTDTASALSIFVNQMSQQGLNLTEAERLGAWADFWQEQSRHYAQRANELSNMASMLGDNTRAAIWENAAQQMRDYAAQRDTMGTDVWLDMNQRSLSTTMDALGRYGGPIGDAIAYAQMTEAVRIGDWDTLGRVSSGALFGLGGGLLGAGLVGLGMWPVAIVAGVIAFAGGELGEGVWDQLSGGAQNLVTDTLTPVFELWDQTLNWVTPPVLPRAPLALDLDGDGIETLAANGYGGVLFDQNGDGVRRATGWIASDDGLLALDRNGNGTIDNGTELFGNSTPTAGGTAADGLSVTGLLEWGIPLPVSTRIPSRKNTKLC
ncbi:MAG: hypothetical protein GXP14_11850 [Gammaproteobacteria bacterium]|nr:hypothetical protein [Gammaproteobacteria bacterium]